MIDATFPVKLKPLFKQHRYKIAHGGRGSGKSWAFARALLIQGAGEKLRILCTREIQKSIKQSVHQLLSDQIQSLGLGSFYQILETEIRGVNGTLISFTGLSSHTVESVKSYESIDIVWVEEAQTVCHKSWKILIPTIRKPNSEIWLTFNPELDTDETYVRFVLNTPPDSMCVRINYNDNKWFPDVLEKERLHDKQHLSEDEYNNIWEGKCKAAVDGAIYANEVADAQAEGRVCNVPYDPLLKVHVVFDLGWNDAMFISLVQRGVSDARVIESIEDSHKTLDVYSASLKKHRYNWGKVFLPHDGGHRDFKTGLSS
ncbi:MAG: PBSX family phage terminase large subunit, partial [Gammaproteobacteria bacterium]|nr:PBSX family phage terminase large subunit [Gammaproteobacteria bacterium]